MFIRRKKLNEIFDIASIRKSMRRGQARDSSELSKWEEFKISSKNGFYWIPFCAVDFIFLLLDD